MKKISLVCGLLISALVMMTSCSKSSNEGDLSQYPDYIPFKLDEDGDYGLLGRDGKILFSDEFSDVISCSFEGVFVKGTEGDYSLYKAEKKPVLIKGCEELYDVGAMQEGLIAITKKNERISFIDKEGDLKFTLNPYKEKEIVEVGPFSDGLAFFKTEDDKCGFIDKNGKIVIEPKYSVVTSFSEGASIVLNEKDWIIIDKTGKEVKKLKEIKPAFLELLEEGIMATFYDGKLLCVNEKSERYVLIDKRGEVIKKFPKDVLPVEFVGDYYIYFNKKEGFGVNNLKDETVIRAKYEELGVISEKRFIAKKNNGEVVIINQDSEVEQELSDYKSAIFHNGIIYAETEENKYELLNEKGEKISEEEFIIENIEELWTSCSWSCVSDYFRIEDVAKKIVASITENGMGNFVLGKPFDFGNPEDYDDNLAYANIIDTKKTGINVNIPEKKGSLVVEILTADLKNEKRESIVLSQYDETRGEYVKTFNPKAQIDAITCSPVFATEETMKKTTENLTQFSKAMLKELKANGWKLYVEGKYNHTLTKGNLGCNIVVLNTGEIYSSGIMIFLKSRLSDEKTKKEQIKLCDQTIDELLNEE